ncbi:hypothetical protein AB0E10_05435 [Streptomyces sp. NPDC048045]|uniref:hypothetical protein n=1 Tax=Streptomyces sp. NPDC048045 TaxID=3154710 RepID=UPI003416AC1F
MAKALLVATAVPALLVSTSAAASADGWVTWKNQKSGLYLTANNSGAVKGDWAMPGVNETAYQWYDTSNSDGSYNESNGYGMCLVGYYRQVYTEGCNSRRDQTNWWQRWYEISTSSGWKLKNRQTGWILDDEGHGGIYANSGDYNNSNQRWK